MRIPSFVFGWLVVGICCAAGADSARGLQLTDAFVSGADGYHTYRIPALLVTSKGTLLAFCEGRKGGRSDTGDIDLLVKRSADGGRTWSRQQIVWDDGANTCDNPCPVVDRTTGAIWLPMTWNHGQDNESAIKRNAGRDTRRVFVTHSDDHGRTWRLGGVIRPAVNECQAVELIDGTILINMRNYDRSKTMRAVAASTDGGMTWSAVRHDPALVEPVCQASLLRYTMQPPDGRNRLLFSNPAHAEPGQRRDMTVRMSEDEGKTRPVSRVLWPGAAAYSCLAVLPGGDIARLFEAGEEHPYQRIILARFSRDWLTGADAPP